MRLFSVGFQPFPDDVTNGLFDFIFFFALKYTLLRQSDSRGLPDDLPLFQCQQHAGTASVKGRNLQGKDHHVRYCREHRFYPRTPRSAFELPKSATGILI